MNKRWKFFRQQHDEYIRRKQAIPDDEQRRGVLSKAVGQLARISGVLFGLEQAFQVAESGEEARGGGGGYLVERWVRGCAAQIGCFFGLSGFTMAPFLFENWF